MNFTFHEEYQYLILLDNILKNGHESKDRTGVGTKRIFGAQMRFDLSKGFPLLTTKKVFWKGVVGELLWILRNDTNVKYLQDNNIHIWDQWCDENGNFGPIYGHQMRNFGGKYENVFKPIPKYPFKPVETENHEIFQTPSGREFIVIEKSDQTTVQFIKTGTIKILDNNRVFNRDISDNMDLTVCGVGYLEDASLTVSEPFLEQKWRNMLKRCYYKNYEHYSYYGGKGVHVSDRWLSLKNFVEDTKKLEGYDPNNNELELDKDILGNGFVYSKETCCWVGQEENKSHAQCYRTFTVKNSSNELFTFTNSTIFRSAHGIKNQGNFNSMLRGERSLCEGFSLVEAKDNRKGVDQLANVISQIKSNPDSRRLVISLWNAEDVPYQGLPCCHGTAIQFGVINGKLNCHMFQRSADIFLGAPFNIASYALLTHMIAQVTGLKVGEFVHSITDAHLYMNHIDQAKEQLQREPFPFPKLHLNFMVNDIDKFTIDDISLVDYQSHASIKAPIAI